MTSATALLRRTGRTRDGRAYLIRPTRAADSTALVALRDAVAAEGDLIAASPGGHTALEEELALAGLLSQGGLSLTLEVEGDPAGHLMVRALHGDTGSEGELAILVHNTARGLGLGRALIEVAIAWGRAVRLARLRLGVFPDNQRAIALYRAVGFVDDRLVRDYPVLPGLRHDLLFMSLRL